LIGQTIPSYTAPLKDGVDIQTNLAKDAKSVCNLLTIGNNGSFSKIPLGIAVLTYTLSYLVYIISKNNLENNNIPTLIFFPVLILCDLIWNIRNACYPVVGIIISILVGGLMGWAWAYIIDGLNKPGLFFLNLGSDKTVCQRPTQQLFKCTFANPSS
jgi:hypothetical protein